MAPLVDQLQPFWWGHEAGDGGAAAAAMLGHVRRAWPDIGEVEVTADEGEERSADELALGIVRDVGEVARILISAPGVAEELAWARANLISDLERYATLVARQT
jgi:hypothetical protein